ncbi:MAG: Rpn family recombination-promoting nuclease/putative transposase [Clostridiales bacterium]|jgi:predicted transposase/invertase (TIGR01784 family)|nr:Rpn family recombination-promoting nuclease/putative transposase [Clostridiales bacterium]
MLAIAFEMWYNNRGVVNTLDNDNTEDFFQEELEFNLLELEKDSKGNFIAPEILPPSEDGVFKVFMTHPDGGVVRKDFLESALKIKIKSIFIRNNEPQITSLTEKRTRYDVNCTIDEEDDELSQADVEMNAFKMKEDSLFKDYQNMKERIAYTLTQLHTDQNSKGITYRSFRKSYHIAICSYVIFPDVDSFVIDDFTLNSPKTGKLLSEKITAIIIELPKLSKVLKKPVKDMDDLEKWSIFLAYSDKPKYKKLIEEIAESKEAIRVAIALLSTVSKDENERASYLSRLIARMDHESDINTALQEGERKGEIKGEIKGVRNLVTEMLNNGITDAEIKKYYHYTDEDIKTLRAEIAKGNTH